MVVGLQDKYSTHQQLLFVFPTITNLTMITLHYYSSYYQSSAVSPKQEPAGRMSVNVNFNSSAKKVLMVKLSSDFYLH